MGKLRAPFLMETVDSPNYFLEVSDSTVTITNKRNGHTTITFSNIAGIYCIWVLGRVYIKDHWHPYKMNFDDYDGQ